MTVTPVPRLLTVADIARLSQFSERTIRREIRAERLQAKRIRGCLRVLETEYQRWAEPLAVAS